MKEAVLIIGFNRLQKIKAAVQKVLEYSPRETYVFCDGARKNVPGEPERCAEVREYVKLALPASTHYLFPESNLGCRGGPPAAISWFLGRESRGIILEDDIVPTPNFFRFCEHYLELYEHDPRISLVSGFNPLGKLENEIVDGVTKYPQIWGWATWRRAWKGYSNRLSMKEIEREEARIRTWVGRESHYQYWKGCFRRIAVENMNTWDYQLVFHVLKNRGLGILPAVNLVRNVGFDSEATHTVQGNYSFPLMKEPLDGKQRSVDLDSHGLIDDRIARDHYHIPPEQPRRFERHYYRRRIQRMAKDVVKLVVQKVKRALGIRKIKFWETR